ncbi:hypothetical protein [Streptomyces sp. SCUT-3]|uniref:hypothetical protein n=1 Tax=Streptomyces sp. SCUT-3 TaxID=2684469 RepID=UPI001C713345|nr:hypothetical protein [Streptomyces sp. SCUT-3]
MDHHPRHRIPHHPPHHTHRNRTHWHRGRGRAGAGAGAGQGGEGADQAELQERVDAGQARAALRVLHRYGLLTDDARAGNRAVRLHALTARATRETTPTPTPPPS